MWPMEVPGKVSLWLVNSEYPTTKSVKFSSPSVCLTYMFMNKISMSQTCIQSYKKATRFLQQPVATEGIRL